MKEGQKFLWGVRHIWFVGRMGEYYVFEDANGERFTFAESATWDLEEA